MSNDMISMQEKALAADIRHNLNDKQQLHLAAIRRRASEIARKYQLDSAMLPPLRTAIRQDTVSRWHVKDLHDLPESMLPEALAGINTWDSYSTIRKLRQR